MAGNVSSNRAASSTPQWIRMTVYVLAAVVIVAFVSGVVFFR